MNAFFFSARRADLAILAYGRRLLAPHGLTPARFDMLYILWSRELGNTSSQEEIKRALGVSRPTISRMLKSLAELGLITRFGHRRNRRAALTRLGRAVMRRAIRDVKKPVTRDVAELFGAAKKGLLQVEEKVEGVLGLFKYRFGKRLNWQIYSIGEPHPDD